MGTQHNVLITGAGGEIGHGLIRRLAEEGSFNIVTLDLKGLNPELAALCTASHTGDVLDAGLIAQIFSDHKIDGLFHLAAMLSSSGERNPERAFDVNVGGTMNLLKSAGEQARLIGQHVKFIFPSTIAVYGLPDPETKQRANKVKEDEYLFPITMYGVNKLSCEHLGRYYAHHYGALSEKKSQWSVDFRALRFPGLISAHTVPSGGTSDYVPEMLHAAAAGQPYACFARSDTRIPFMTMPDAVESILRLFFASREVLTTTVYNVGAFAPSAAEVEALLKESFSGVEISYEVNESRQSFLDTWPADVDDTAARNDWGHNPRHGFREAFADYLIPALSGAHAD
ncbi:MAG: NAD-dependent epimerase/dehydratase family protein [Ignavibacteriae bacterium]|nr:NAD-dependent epimerase/dehydratase family protein [Ignavibacteriota bacterium]MCB9215922.1 NAD-dependent epimerase/dehydratase family protein [Ignavibacteria bacterium]